MGDLDAVVMTLVEGNLGRLFQRAEDTVRLRSVDLGEPLHRNGPRHHRLVKVHGEVEGRPSHARLWLKFVNDRPERFEVHQRVYERTRTRTTLFPRPFFYAPFGDDCILAMEVIEGRVLRDRFLRDAALRRDRDLHGAFAQLGQGLRAFHDVSEPCRHEPVHALHERIQDAVRRTGDLDARARARLLERVETAVAAAGAETHLPLIPIHHDCTLRNVVLEVDGSPRVLDLDAVVARPKSRWYDLVILLTNVESFVKYRPVLPDRKVAAAAASVRLGYLASGWPDGMTADQGEAILDLIRVDYVFNGTSRPASEVYEGPLNRRYLRRLIDSVVTGEPVVSG